MNFAEEAVSRAREDKDYAIMYLAMAVGELQKQTAPPQRESITDEIDRLRKALVYVAHSLHATPQYMLAKGITLLDGDAVRVSIDGWAVEASNKTIEAAHGIIQTYPKKDKT